MGEMIKMVVVLLVLSLVSGSLLAKIHDGTKGRIENQILKFVKGPAIEKIFSRAENDPLEERYRFKIEDGKSVRSFYIGRYDGKANAVSFEGKGKGGYGGDIGVMVGVNINDDRLVGVGVTTHSETPGMGSKAQTDPKFAAQFETLTIDQVFKVKADGGKIDAISGATMTSRAVSAGLNDAAAIYKRLKPKIIEQLKGSVGTGEKDG